MDVGRQKTEVNLRFWSGCRDAFKTILSTSFFCGYGFAFILWRLCFVIVSCSVGTVRGHGMVALKIDFCFLLRWYVTARIDLCLVGFKHGVFATAFSVRAAFNWTLDWTRYFQQEKVFHIKCQLEDTTLTPPHRWDERIPDLVASCWNSGKLSVANSGNNPCWQ